MPKINLDIGRKADSEKEKKPVIDIWAYAEPAGEEPDPLKKKYSSVATTHYISTRSLRDICRTES